MSVERLTPRTLSFVSALFPRLNKAPASLACSARVRLCISLMVELIFFLTCFSGMCGTSWPLTFSYTEPGRKSDNRCLWGNCTFSADPLSRRKNWIEAGLEVIFFSFILFFEGGGGGGRETILFCFFLWGERNTDASMPNLRLVSPPLFATLETRRRLEPKYILQLFLG